MKKAPILLLAVPLLWLPSAAQKRTSRAAASPVAEYKLEEIKITGTARYTEKDILPAIGLRLGQNASEADFKDAVRRLGETGLFTGVAYSYTSSSTGARLDLRLQDIDEQKMVPARFENLVWLTDAELIEELARRVPLFKGKLPVAGGLIDQVTEAVQAVLDEKQVAARIDYVRDTLTEGGDVVGISYKVPDLTVQIQQVEFRGAATDLVPQLTAAARKLMGTEYVRSSLQAIAKVDLLPVYLERGYLKASFGPADARILPHPSAPSSDDTAKEVDVAAIFPVNAGKVYSVSDVAWKGNAALPAAQLEPLIHLPSGQPADAVRLRRDLEDVTRLYHARGYMAADVKPVPTMDDENGTVHYSLVVAEGDRFKMGELEVTGLDSQLKTRLEDAWALREGEPYNSDYPKKFAKDTMQLLPEFTRWDVSVHEAVNERDKTVDVMLKYRPR